MILRRTFLFRSYPITFKETDIDHILRKQLNNTCLNRIFYMVQTADIILVGVQKIQYLF